MLLALLGVVVSDISLFVFSIKKANVNLPKYFHVLAIKKAPFHSNTSPYNTPNLPQPNTSCQQNHTPVSAKFRYTSTVSLQTADTTTVKTTHLRKTLRQTLNYIICCEDGECLCWGTRIIRFITITVRLFSQALLLACHVFCRYFLTLPNFFLSVCFRHGEILCFLLPFCLVAFEIFLFGLDF